jgi:hypothetical protein
MFETNYNFCELINRITELENNPINKKYNFENSDSEQLEIEDSYNFELSVFLIKI